MRSRDFAGVRDANVYGVPCPAATAAPAWPRSSCDDQPRSGRFARAIWRRELPEYARPVFLRIREDIDVTATFKQKKVDLVKDGFDPDLYRSIRSISTIRRARPSCGSIRMLYAAHQGDGRIAAVTDDTGCHAGDVLAFWRAAGPDKWFKKDADVRRRDPIALPRRSWEDAAAGRLSAWEATPNGALALVIVLDQFPRNMFRGDRRTYQTDATARAVAERAIARDFDRRVPESRPAFLLPAVHAFGAAVADQERCLALAPRHGDEEFLRYAMQHADIIRRFGRFPHRNAILGRSTTAEEQAFLDAGGFAG